MPSGDQTINLFARCFIAAVIAFVVFSPLYRGYGQYSSWFDAIAARRVARILKILVFVELIRNFWLLYCVVELGDPTLSPYRGVHYYWTFGYIRPVLGIITISMGFVGELHAAFRITCAVGALTQCTFDFFSAFLLGEYLIQVHDHNASTGEYTSFTLLQYYWRDLVSFGICIWISLLALYLCCIVGFFANVYVSYQAINGGPTDRLLTLETEREKRKIYDYIQHVRYDYLSSSSNEQMRRKKSKSADGSKVDVELGGT